MSIPQEAQASPGSPGRRGELESPSEEPEFFGVAVSPNSREIFPHWDGVLATVEVSLGDSVEKDQVVATLDLGELESEIAEAAAEWEKAKANSREALELAEPWENLVSIPKVDPGSIAAPQEVAAYWIALREEEQAELEKQLATKRHERRRQVSQQFSEQEVEEAQLAAALARVIRERHRAEVTRRYAIAEAARKDAVQNVSMTFLESRISKEKKDRLELRRKRSRVLSPISGLVAFRYLNPGEPTSSSTPILVVVPHEDLRLRFAVPADLAHRIELRDSIIFQPRSHEVEIFGTIIGISSEIEEFSRMIVAEAELDLSFSRRSRVLPGSIGAVRVLP